MGAPGSGLRCEVRRKAHCGRRIGRQEPPTFHNTYYVNFCLGRGPAIKGPKTAPGAGCGQRALAHHRLLKTARPFGQVWRALDKKTARSPLNGTGPWEETDAFL